MAREEIAQLKEEFLRKDGVSIVKVVDKLISVAQILGASDVHLTPTPKEVKIKLRIDGSIQEVATFPNENHSEVVSRIKVLAGLRTDEHQSAQDGRFRIDLGQEGTVDVRVSIVPTYHGENTVLRILPNKSEQFSLENLGFSKSDTQKITEAINKPYGMILATGPTGSGKTTTLYTIIKMLGSKKSSIVTIEDPIEYAIDNVTQIQINPRTGLTFAGGLKAILRQDPNVIMVGEIRDQETAGIAVNTALTGHLLLSTLHTNDASTTLPRLLDMKVEPFLIASTVNIAIGQRLVRTICQKCKTEEKLSKIELDSIQKAFPNKKMAKDLTLFKGSGCDHCVGSGYSGRIAINEVLTVDHKIREAILKKSSASEIKKIAMKNGMTTMTDDGLEKVLQGITTVEEILRVTRT